MRTLIKASAIWLPLLLWISGCGKGINTGSESPSSVVPTYSLTFDENGSTGGSAPAAQTGASGATMTLPSAGTLVKSGYVLSKWNTKSDGTGTDYAIGASFTMPASDTTLYAKWAVAYTITFNGNGHTSGTVPSAVSVEDGTSYTAPSEGTLVKTGAYTYTFSGWNTASNALGTFYEAGASIPVSGAAVTLYAVWSATVYVSPSGNDTSGDGTSANPYLTIAKAISVAPSSASEVRVANGTYTLTSHLVLKESMRLFGGYDPSTWVRDYSTFQTQLSTANDWTISCSSLTGYLIIEGLKFTSTGSGSPTSINLSTCPNAIVRHNWLLPSSTNGAATAVTLSGTFSGSIESNIMEVYGDRYTDGIFLTLMTGGDFKIQNNVIRAYYPNGTNSPPNAIRFNGGSGTKTIRVRNNTIVFGRRINDTAYALGESATNSSGTINVYFDNNIVLGAYVATANYTLTGLYQGNNSTWNIQSLKNNNFFRMDSIFTSTKNSQNFTSIAAMEAGVGAAASSNISVEMVTAGYFTDATNGDFSLSATAPASIKAGGLKGDDLSWGFSKDLLGNTRTGSSGTGWSMGAYERD